MRSQVNVKENLSWAELKAVKADFTQEYHRRDLSVDPDPVLNTAWALGSLEPRTGSGGKITMGNSGTVGTPAKLTAQILEEDRRGSSDITWGMVEEEKPKKSLE